MQDFDIFCRPHGGCPDWPLRLPALRGPDAQIRMEARQPMTGTMRMRMRHGMLAPFESKQEGHPPC